MPSVSKKATPIEASLINAAVKEMLAYSKGEIDKDALNARIDKLAGK